MKSNMNINNKSISRNAFSIIVSILIIILINTADNCYSADNLSNKEILLLSPDNNIKIFVNLDTEAKLYWSVQMQGQAVIEKSPLGLTVDGKNLGQEVNLGIPSRRVIDETYPIFGNHSVAVNHCNEAVVPVSTANGLKFELDLRAYNDGVAVRTRIDLDDTTHFIAGESTSWKLPAKSKVWWARYDNSYERPCESSTYETLPVKMPMAPPITFKLDNDIYVSLTEANNDCFPDMGLMRVGDHIKSIFPPSAKGWSHKGSIVTPWRVATIAKGLNSLVNSDIVTNLCPPPSEELANADWVKPGRSLWQWWAIGAPRMEDQKQWINAAKRLGFEYYLIDDGWRRWRSQGKDQWQCLKDVIDYGKSQGVKSLVWVNSAEMRDTASRRSYLEKVAAIGASGIKIDFIPACTAEITRWYEGALKDTAELKLLCNFHGAVKPTGRRRTWPHELTREAVRGHEYHMTRYGRVQAADHDPTVLYTRYLAGPGDYTPTAFDLKEMVGYTWARLLAQSVVMTSPLQHFAGKYQDFIDNPSEDFLRHLPATWDETIVLPGSEIGKVTGFARRSGQEWYIGVVNGTEPANMKIDFSFLGPGKWQTDFFGDIPGEPAKFDRKIDKISASDSTTVSMVPRGGAVFRITKTKTKVKMFPLTSVRLLDSYFTKAVSADKQYLLDLKPDRLLAPFLTESGLTPKARTYGNWESMEIAGHTGGHYLSALALMIATGNDESGEFDRRLNYMLAELERCQKAGGDGYIGGITGGREFWKRIAAGEVDAVWDKWAPWYNVHKTFAGLRDAYQLASKEKARELLVNIGDWCLELISGLSEGQMQQMLSNEYGGMNEVMADIYIITGDAKYLNGAKRFSHKSLFEPLMRHEDRLTGLHANTQVPKIIGMELIASLTNNAREHSGAEFFWERVSSNRSVVFGGNSVSEHFNPVDDFSKMLQHREGPETCNTYNMLRLTRQLFMAEPKASYADFYERALYNHILSTINIENPGFVYFTPIRPDHYRTYSQPDHCFWCCVGTGMENPGRYSEFIYAHDNDDGVFVNLFIPSELKMADGATLVQNTKFPYKQTTNFSFRLEKPQVFSLRLRHPGWVRKGEFMVSVNGKELDLASSPCSYAAIKREWKDGDVVKVSMPMHTSIERLPDDSDWVAVLHGPIVLAKPDGTENMDGLFADDGRMSHVAYGPMPALDKVTQLLTTSDGLLNHIVPDLSDGPLNFRIKDVVFPAKTGGVQLVPFFSLHERRYQMYWELTSPDKIAARQEKLAEEERLRAAREAATIDQVSIGEQQPEVEHDFEGKDTETGIYNGRRWRHGAMIQYTLNTRGEKSVELEVTYSGSDRGRVFDIYANDIKIATQELTGEKPEEFIAKRYSIPDSVIDASEDGHIVVKFVATRWLAGGLYDLRLMRQGQ